MSSKKLIWWTGHSANLEWMQFGDQDSKMAHITFTRELSDGSVTILIHKINDESPAAGPARFSLETGLGEHTLAVDGFGMIIEMNDGSMGFQTPALAGENKTLFANVIDRASDHIRVVINEGTYTFPTTQFHPELKKIFRPTSFKPSDQNR